MKRLLMISVSSLAIAAASQAMAAGPSAWDADGFPGPYDGNGLPGPWVWGPACDPTINYGCPETKAWDRMRRAQAAAQGTCDPYVDFKCLDTYLGNDPATRFFRYYQLEWGHATAPADPNAPASSRPDSVVPPTPQTTPPMPFTEWPYGGTQNIGKTLPSSIDSPFMVAIANTQLGKAMNDAHIQVYGWLDPAGNISTNTVRPAGNLPISYDYTPNTVQLDQSVLYVERLPDEVQNDHFDWGFRVSFLYGVDGRYTTAYGLFSSQLLSNQTNIFDMPMIYADLYYPVMQGLNVRIGRFISIPDIEAQLAPNNYTYVHSLTYTWDNYTNTGVEATLALTKNWIVQMGTSVGTEALPWHFDAKVGNAYTQTGNCAASQATLGTGGLGCGVDPLYPGNSMLKDPGAVPSFTIGLRWTSSDGKDDLNVVADAQNAGQWGDNNLQWVGLTYYHKFNDYWHFAFETWNIHENNVPNLNNPVASALIANNGTPFSPEFMPFNGPNAAWCGGPHLMGQTIPGSPLTCNPDEQTFLLYINYSPDKLNNFSLRTEYFNDPYGQRTGVATAYSDIAWSWQHWFSPQIEARPEIGYYRSLDNPAFNGNVAAGIAPTKDWAVIAASDLIFHF
jgi:Putative beta-barrel porin-2, OmpL-like. bbp2